MAVLVEPRVLADMLSMLLTERGAEIVAGDDDAVDVVVVNQARLGDVRAESASATVVLPDDDGEQASSSSTLDLTRFLATIEGRPAPS